MRGLISVYIHHGNTVSAEVPSGSDAKAKDRLAVRQGGSASRLCGHIVPGPGWRCACDGAAVR
eukprot:3124501-Prymnesium_polylepis.1